ncbi:hypothetical protein ACKKBG_A35465 [Auxenochlorella protothecoides x Auxenochlorella symbiontica]
MLDHLKVEVYGDSMPMKACGMATVRDPQLLVFNVFDPQTLHSVENAIRDSPLGLNPRVEGQDLLIPVPRCGQRVLEVPWWPGFAQAALAGQEWGSTSGQKRACMNSPLLSGMQTDCRDPDSTEEGVQDRG